MARKTSLAIHLESLIESAKARLALESPTIEQAKEISALREECEVDLLDCMDSVYLNLERTVKRK